MAKEIKRDAQGHPIYGVTVQVAALCVIVMQYVQSFVSPALAAVRGTFGQLGIDTVMIQQIQGIPSLMAIFGAILVGILERYMKKKHILILAMVLMFLGSLAGVVPETQEGFYLLLATRVVLGLGRGMIFPMASSFIADLFYGKQRDRLMSFKTAVGGISGSIFQVIGGALAVLSWRYAFIGMLMAVPIAIMIIAWLKEPEVKPAGTTADGKKGNPLRSITAISWLIIIVAGIWNIFQFSYMTSASLTISAVGLGDTGIAGWIMSLETMVSAVGAICYGAFLKGRMGGFDLPIALALETAGFFFLTHQVDMMGMVIGTVLYGFGFGMLNPALILQFVRVLPKEGATLGLSLLAGSQNFFQFWSAPVLAAMAPMFGVQGFDKATQALANWNVAWIMGIVYFIFVLCLIIFGKIKHPELIAGLKESNAPAVEEKVEEDMEKDDR